MPPSINFYENEINRRRLANRLLSDEPGPPTLLPCHTLVNLACRLGRKLAVFVFPGGIREFAGVWDNLDDFHRCMAINNTYANAEAELRWATFHEGKLISDTPLWRLGMKFRMPDYVALRGVRRPGLAVPYVW